MNGNGWGWKILLMLFSLLSSVAIMVGAWQIRGSISLDKRITTIEANNYTAKDHVVHVRSHRTMTPEVSGRLDAIDAKLARIDDRLDKLGGSR